MLGLNSISIPIFFEANLKFLENFGFIFNGLFSNNIFTFYNYFDNPIIWIIFLSAISFFGTNIYEILNSDFKVYEKNNSKLIWRPNLKWSMVTIILLVFSITKISGDAKFLYFQF